ncbi:M56 family metallopeptidase [Hymenobacter sp. HSC-4F20]|uniref:M56 family metallopeptidase n=1 Tax=Hymenobacter sp. HSC-4F20 TaxID=2864135 RepID=UPI001C733776|nr:M56 family metallopeptidase [Hymenobacter sp. HSC-4F20]MBX0291726.1 M56 family metallopeptidase [Hymenobacter sp. HSC-4F20]
MIPALLLYLIKANLALSVLLGLYYALLRRLTFHTLNRLYLAGVVLFSATYPLLDVSVLLPRPAALENQLSVLLPSWAGSSAAASMPPAGTSVTGGFWLLAIYWVGVGFMTLRLLVQGASLAGVHRASRPAQVAGVRFREVAAAINPFSFWRTIYLNPAQHARAELPAILLHEQVHVRQWHTLDVLLGHAQRIFGWWNPGAWLLLRAIQENLEFITDAAVLRAGHVSPRDYQYSLVQLSTLAPGPALVTPFSFITLKNRIQMMNSLKSSRVQASRYLLVLPLALGLLSFSAPEATSAMLSAPAPAVSTEVETPAPISALPPAALAYIVQQYPGYRLIGLTEVRAADGSNLRYRAEIAYGRRPEKVLFSADGQPLTAAAAEPLYFLDGQPSTKEAVYALDPKAIESMNVLTGEQGRKAFGEKAADGAILIITKKNKDSAAVQTFIKEHNIVMRPAAAADQRVLSSVGAGRGISSADLAGRLLIINDKEATVEQANIPVDQIISVNVLDAERATKKYGAKGRQGAIIISTK